MYSQHKLQILRGNQNSWHNFWETKRIVVLLYNEKHPFLLKSYFEVPIKEGTFATCAFFTFRNHNILFQNCRADDVCWDTQIEGGRSVGQLHLMLATVCRPYIKCSFVIHIAPFYYFLSSPLIFLIFNNLYINSSSVLPSSLRNYCSARFRESYIYSTFPVCTFFNHSGIVAHWMLQNLLFFRFVLLWTEMPKEICFWIIDQGVVSHACSKRIYLIVYYFFRK